MSRTALTVWPAAEHDKELRQSYSTAEQTAAELNVSVANLPDLIARRLILPPDRYIRGLPEWDIKSTWKSRSRVGKVYLAGFGSYVKIGFTSGEIEYRIAAMQTGCPEKIEIFALLDGTAATEAALHRRFSRLRAYGEWFRREGDLAAWIDGGCR